MAASRPARDILFSLSGPPANISTSLSGGQRRSNKTRYFHFIDQNAGVAYRFANYRDLKESKVQVFFDIQSKKARDISDISEFNGNFAPEDQREVLFTNGTGFKIVKHEISGQEVRITLVEL